MDRDRDYRDEMHITRARALMYSSIYILLSEVPQHIRLSAIDLLFNMNKDLARSIWEDIDKLKNIRARTYRRDLDSVTRTHIPKAIEMCYINSGYIVKDHEPDSIQAMLAFISKLIDDEANSLAKGDDRRVHNLRKIQIRFINTHLKPLIAEARKVIRSRALELLESILDNDVEYLKLILINPNRSIKDLFKLKYFFRSNNY